MFASPEAKGAKSKTQKYAANSRNTERDGMPQCIYPRFLYAEKPLCSGVPESAAYFRRVNSEVRRKTGACRPDPGFWHPRPAVLLAKIGVCYTIRPANYLLHKGVSTNNGYTQSFIDITNELLSTKQASVRTCNRFTDPIKKQLDYTDTHQSIYGNGKARLFPNLCLLPIFNVLVYFEPLGWYEVKTNANFSSVYELAKHSKDFIQCLDMVIEEVWGPKRTNFLISRIPRPGTNVLLRMRVHWYSLATIEIRELRNYAIAE